MGYTQAVAPNTGTQDNPGWCLRFTQTVYGAPVNYYCARDSWDGSDFKHTEAPPSGVSVPVYWSWIGTINGETRDWGHIAALLPDGRVLSSPLRWSDGYGQTIAGSIDEVSNMLGATFLGWTEDMNTLRIVNYTDTPTPEPTPPNRTYTVQPGDTLWGIAVLFYGDGTRYPEIAAANGIENPNLIFPGQEFIIP